MTSENTNEESVALLDINNGHARNLQTASMTSQQQPLHYLSRQLAEGQNSLTIPLQQQHNAGSSSRRPQHHIIPMTSNATTPNGTSGDPPTATERLHSLRLYPGSQDVYGNTMVDQPEPQTSLQAPKPLQSFRATVNMPFAPGYYATFWCISVPPLQANVTYTIESQVATDVGNVSERWTSSQPLSLPNSGQSVYFRLRLPVWLDSNTEIRPRLIVKTVHDCLMSQSTTASVKPDAAPIVHFYEILPCRAEEATLASNIFIMGASLNVVGSFVPPSIQTSSRTYVKDIGISPDFNHVATLSESGAELTIDTWDWTDGSIEHSRLPQATAKISWPFDENVQLAVDISMGGSYVALFEIPNKSDKWDLNAKLRLGGFPVRIFTDDTSLMRGKSQYQSQMIGSRSGNIFHSQTPLGTPININPTSPNPRLVRTLELVGYTQPMLDTFVGFVKFKGRSLKSTEPNKTLGHILVTNNGLHLDVFDVTNKFQLLHTISLIELVPHPSFFPPGFPRSEYYGIMMHRLGANLFSSYHEGRVVTVWNWWTGEEHLRLEMPIGFNPMFSLLMSPDEKFIVVAGQKSIATYSLSTGVAVDLITFASGRLEIRLIQYLPGNRILIRTVDRTEGDDIQILHHVLNVQYLSDTYSLGEFPSLAGYVVRPTPLQVDGRITELVRLSPPMGIEFVPVTSQSEPDRLHCTQSCDSGGPRGISIDTTATSGDYRLELDASRCHLKLQRSAGVTGGSLQVLLESTAIVPIHRVQHIRFLSCGKRFIIIRIFSFELWQLPTCHRATCELLAAQAFPCGMEATDHCEGWTLCAHDSILRLNYFDKVKKSKDILISRNQFVDEEDTQGFIRSLFILPAMWSTFNPEFKQAMVELTLKHINRHPKRDESYFAKNIYDHAVLSGLSRSSVMLAIARTSPNAEPGSFIHTVLEGNDGLHWVPHSTEFSTNPKADMISCLILTPLMEAALLLIEYCLIRARYTDPAFLDMLMVSVPHFVLARPDVALNIARRSAFIPASNIQEVMQFSHFNKMQWRFFPRLIKGADAGGLSLGSLGRLTFWTPKIVTFRDYSSRPPPFQLQTRLPLTSGSNMSATKPRPMTIPDLRVNFRKVMERDSNIYVVPFSLMWGFHPNDEEKDRTQQGATLVVSTMALFLRLMWHLLIPFGSVKVKAHYSNLETFDNPALVALMEYKWSRFARNVWMMRMVFQTGYQVLVLATTFLQIYGGDDHQDSLKVCFICIIILGYTLLHLEIQQMRGGFRRYLQSPYNYIDLAVYIIPLVSSVLELSSDANVLSSSRFLSFAIVLIYMHIVFELRVFNNVCEVVTIVVNIVLRIPAFFGILAIFVLAFAHSINHLVEINSRLDCSTADDGSIPECAASRAQFPREYFQSVSATYFFMTGNYDPVSSGIAGGHWTIQLMVGIFFFLTAVLMMNVVIALMNNVFEEAVIAGRRIWLKNRIDLITNAENLSFFIPYFRQKFDYFPKFVYYTATHHEVDAYIAKFKIPDPSKNVFGFKKPTLQPPPPPPPPPPLPPAPKTTSQMAASISSSSLPSPPAPPQNEQGGSESEENNGRGPLGEMSSPVGARSEAAGAHLFHATNHSQIGHGPTVPAGHSPLLTTAPSMGAPPSLSSTPGGAPPLTMETFQQMQKSLIEGMEIRMLFERRQMEERILKERKETEDKLVELLKTMLERPVV